ncbi:hypothetical protein NP590_02540 [Methylomonas sp. SURF-2]|uniref:PEP-CTERM protein-sorting domain-containing protein n=1 Tax=Methylomonas subterranea TaxID=2952225 RepID=A0ABT1TBY2_9GAMM|nr:hypothetical protein [Methylomonas sp. SURF-2]MCQ8102972.1 hypothetical protein [Methylomonas sp. SURF-2]
MIEQSFRRKYFRLAAGVLSLAAMLSPSCYASVTQESHDVGVWLIDDFGQSFIARDAAIQSIGIVISDWNPTEDSPFIVEISLFAGADFTAAPISSKSVQLEDGFGGVNGNGAWFDFDFSDVVLNIGGAYAFNLHSPHQRGGVFYADTDPYPDGVMYQDGEVFSDTSDLAFRVMAKPVPLPLSAWFMASGLLGLSAFSRKSSNRQASMDYAAC